MIVNFPPGASLGRRRCRAGSDGCPQRPARHGLRAGGRPRRGARWSSACRGRGPSAGRRLAARGTGAGRGAPHRRPRCELGADRRRDAGELDPRAALQLAQPAQLALGQRAGSGRARRPSGGAARRRRPALRPGGRRRRARPPRAPRRPRPARARPAARPARPRAPAAPRRGVRPVPRRARVSAMSRCRTSWRWRSASLSARSVTSAAVRCAVDADLLGLRLGEAQHPLGPRAEAGVGRRGEPGSDDADLLLDGDGVLFGHGAAALAVRERRAQRGERTPRAGRSARRRRRARSPCGRSGRQAG